MRTREPAGVEPLKPASGMSSGATAGYGGNQWGTRYGDRWTQGRLQPGDQDYNLYGGN
jgi:hypothetical protein